MDGEQTSVDSSSGRALVEGWGRGLEWESRREKEGTAGPWADRQEWRSASDRWDRGLAWAGRGGSKKQQALGPSGRSGAVLSIDGIGGSLSGWAWGRSSAGLMGLRADRRT